MATRIRLTRMGKKKKPFYRVIIADSRTPRDGRFLEAVGYYNPLRDPAEVVLREEKVLEWLRKGAKPSATVKSLLERAGIWSKFTTGGQAEEVSNERAG